MPLASFETPAVPATTHALDEGPNLECAPPGHESGDQPLCIRATRHYPVSREDLFATWTRRTAWDSWMRLRARSRATLAPYPGGAFRLELAEGPTIQVITGVVTDLRPHDFLSLHWVHHNTGDQGSVVDVSFLQRRDGTELSLVHRGIGSRREASWLMRLWSAVLGRLGNYVSECAPVSTRRLGEVAAEIPQSSEPEVNRARIHEGAMRLDRTRRIAIAVAARPASSDA
jgi:uncharacterized protein YndB with AHSA1/START domain